MSSNLDFRNIKGIVRSRRKQITAMGILAALLFAALLFYEKGKRFPLQQTQLETRLQSKKEQKELNEVLEAYDQVLQKLDLVKSTGRLSEIEKRNVDSLKHEIKNSISRGNSVVATSLIEKLNSFIVSLAKNSGGQGSIEKMRFDKMEQHEDDLNSIETDVANTFAIELDSLTTEERFALHRKLEELLSTKTIKSSVIVAPFEEGLSRKISAEKSIDFLNKYVALNINSNSYPPLSPSIDFNKQQLQWTARSLDKADFTDNSVGFRIDKKMYELLMNNATQFFTLYKYVPKKVVFEYGFDKIVDIDLLKVRAPSIESQFYGETTSPLPTELTKLKIEDFNDLIIFDVFDGPDTHGLKVYDVVRQVLRFWNLDFALEKVRQAPINYFQNQTFGDSIIKVWNRLSTSYEALENDKPVTIEKLQRLKADYNKTPLTYLQALFEVYLEHHPDVISTSFNLQSTDAFIQNILGTEKDSATNYITASLNELQTYADDYIKKVVSKSGKPMFNEPLYSYISTTDRYGVVVVGNRIAPGKFASMRSKKGNTVHVIGNGTNWGLENCTRYISKADTGTSYATPEVSTLLFIAKAVWRRKKFPMNAVEARDRVLLVSDLDTSFVGKFGSAGTVNLKKLIQTSKAYLVSNSDSIFSIDSVITATVSRYNQDDIIEYSYKFAKEVGKSKIRGIFFKDGRVFIYNKLDGFWKEIPLPTDMSISLIIAGQPKTILLKEFLEQNKQFVFLES